MKRLTGTTALPDWDFIVIGGGSAGAVVASRLSEDPGCRVLLLEAGRSHHHPYVSVPAFMMFSFPRPDMNWHYLAQPDASREGRVDMWPAGKMLGGGSALNGMMFVRGHAYDYDLWAQMGCRGWSHEDVLPYFRKLERSDTGANDQRGGDGPLAVEQPRTLHTLVKPFLAACQELGLGLSNDLNGENREGAGVCQASQSRGARHSTAHAYLDPARNRTNLQVETGILVEQILFDGKRATGVRFRQNGHSQALSARLGIILSAGAMASPKLLMLSGIGDPEALARHGIKALHSLPGVGRNLQEHSGVPLNFEATVPTFTSDQGPIRSPLHAITYVLKRRGPLSTPIGHAQAFVRTEPGLAAPDIQIILSPSSHKIENGKARRKKTPEMGLAVGLCRPLSRGSIQLRSARPEDPPVIDHQLLADPQDTARLVAGLRIARQIIAAPAFAPYVAKVVNPDTALERDDSLAEWVRANAFLMYHPSGSCRMGKGEDAVVDDRLRVHGLEGLWVADASIIPAIPAGNINATCIMIGEKAADMIRADAQPQRMAA
jgi:choline dehydrogenase